MKRKLLIDCDPGMDDALALLFLGSLEQAEVLAVTTSFGRCGGREAFKNAKRIAALLGMNASIASGAQEPVIKESGSLLPSRSEGRVSEEAAGQNAADQHAWDLIYDTAVREAGELEIVTLGPLTNLAVALLKYEDLKNRIKSLTIMGGCAGIGSVTPYGEANVLWDPYAFQIVLQSGIGNMVMFGLDAVETIRFTEEESKEIFWQNSSIGQWLLPLFINDGEKGAGVHALAAAAAGAFPEMVKTKPYHVDVELGKNGQYGRTVVDARFHATAEKNVNVVWEIDRERFYDCLKQTWLFRR